MSDHPELCVQCGIMLIRQARFEVAGSVRLCPCCGLLSVREPDGQWRPLTQSDIVTMTHAEQCRVVGMIVAFQTAFAAGITPKPDHGGVGHA